MVHPFKFDVCVLLLDPLAVVLSCSQCFSGPASALRIDVAVQGAPSPQEVLAWQCTEYFCYTSVSWGKLQRWKRGDLAENSV